MQGVALISNMNVSVNRCELKKAARLMQMAQTENAKLLPKYKMEEYPKPRGSMNYVKTHSRVVVFINNINIIKFFTINEWV